MTPKAFAAAFGGSAVVGLTNVNVWCQIGSANYGEYVYKAIASKRLEFGRKAIDFVGVASSSISANSLISLVQIILGGILGSA